MPQSRAARQEVANSSRSYGGKALDVRRAEQRERLLLAARDVFAARGYAGAGIEEIVGRARVSRTTFYVFFQNKEECLLAVFAHGFQCVGAEVLQAVAESSAHQVEPAERVRVQVRAVAGALAADPAMSRVLLIEVVGATPAAEQARAQARHAAARVIERQLADYAHWGERSPGERHIASLAAMAAIGEAISELVAAGRLEHWEELVDPLSEFVARGLGA